HLGSSRGHRGASAHAPENSAEAFRLAASQGADGVELDVRRTADGALVVHHDASIEEVGPIVDLTAKELQVKAPALATFAEAMAACEGLIVNIEIKNSPMDPDFDPDDRVAEDVARWVSDQGWADRVIISSFNPATVDRLRQLSAGFATGQLIDPGAEAAQQLILAHQRGHKALHP
ncbi:MAG: glycerophosphodiester phosphodiesterase, partial [Actinomycetia bacterium]|nr:glycerophosphodiester phosphodiesterase [Actinomycetes bacterium]